MTNEEKFVDLFKELDLPLEKSESRSSEDYKVYNLFNGAAEIGFDKIGDVEDYHGGYE